MVLTMPLQTQKFSEIPALTGLRFFAAFFVLLAHSLARMLSVPNSIPQFMLPLQNITAEGMTLFFVLSGFVIHYNYSHKIKKNAKEGIYYFLVARFARLWPLYIICLTLSLAIIYIRSSLPEHFFLVISYYVFSYSILVL